MSVEQRRAVTRSDMESFANLVEDTCSDPTCGMVILVDRDMKEKGRKARCMACIMRAKMARGEIK